MGRALAIMSEGAWETPLGTVPIDTISRPVSSSAARFFTKIRRHTATSTPSKSSYRFCRCANPGSGSFRSRSEPSVRSSRTTRRTHCGCDRGAERSGADRRLERYESLRIRRRHAREGSPAIEPISPWMPRALRSGHATERQHVRLRSAVAMLTAAKKLEPSPRSWSNMRPRATFPATATSRWVRRRGSFLRPWIENISPIAGSIL